MADFPINQILSSLNSASIQQKQPALYQAIKSLIEASRSVQVTANAAITIAETGGGTPGDPVNSVQFNNAGAFGGSDVFTFESDRLSIDPAGAVSGNTTLTVGNSYPTNQVYAGFTSKSVFASDGSVTWQTAYVDTTAGVDYAGVISAYPESGVGVFELAGGLNGEAGFNIYPSDYPAATSARIEFFGTNLFEFTPPVGDIAFSFPTNPVVAFTGGDEYTFDASVSGPSFTGTFITTFPFNGSTINSVVPDETTENLTITNVTATTIWAWNAKDNGDLVLQETTAAVDAITLTPEGSVRLVSLPFASLPATPVAGMEANITDSNTNVWGANIAGGGANNVSARYNGANWTVTGK